jgi:hypothetical protein
MCKVNVSILFYVPNSKNTSEKGLIGSHHEKLIYKDCTALTVPATQTSKYYWIQNITVCDRSYYITYNLEYGKCKLQLVA